VIENPVVIEPSLESFEALGARETVLV